MPTNADVTQVSTEIASAPATQNVDVTQVSVEVLRPSADVVAKADVTQNSVEVVDRTELTVVGLDVTQVSVEVLCLFAPVTTTKSAPMMLVDTLAHRGPSAWSTFSAFPLVNGVPSGLVTIKEVQMLDPVSMQLKLGVLASFQNGKVYRVFDGVQDGSVFATAITWPLPDLTQLPFEMRDTMKVFRELWLEGQDINGFELSWSTDGKLITDPTKQFSAPIPCQNRMRLGAVGRQIVLKFTHAAPSSITPLLSYMKLDYGIVGKAAGSQGPGTNY